MAAAVITSWGVHHGPPPPGDALTVDLRTALHNPHHDLAMRELTGLDEAVRARVLATPGARRIVRDTADRAAALLDRRPDARINVQTYCMGGRHRSVAVAEAIGAQLRERGIAVRVEHRDIGKPVIRH